MVAQQYDGSNTINYRLKISTGVAILLALTLLPCMYLIVFVIPDTQSTQIDSLGKLIAQQLSNSSAEQVVHKDALSLSVMLRELVSDGTVTHAVIYTPDNQPLAEAGAQPEETSHDVHTYSENIMIQDSLAGHVSITIRTNTLTLAGIYTVNQWMWIIVAWAFFLLLITIAWISSVLIQHLRTNQPSMHCNVFYKHLIQRLPH
jgi:uncharacterized membrane protein affecting hemolysin expression